MKKGLNCVDELAAILLDGKILQDRSTASKKAKQKLKELSDINMTDRQGRTFLFYCCCYGYNDLARYAVREGADVNSQDKDGFSPLHIAVKYENSELVAFLLKKGAAPKAKNKYGATPAFDAARNWDILKMLLDYGCDIYTKNNYGVSAYDLMMWNPDALDQFREYQK